MRSRVLWQAAAGLLLFAALSPEPTGSTPSQWNWDQHDEALVHSFSRDATLHGARLHYQKGRAECYHKPDRKYNIVITLLLPHQPGNVPVISSGSIQRVLEHTAADVILFHTGWSQQDIEAHVKPKAPYPFEAKCIANADWSTGHRAQKWEALEPGYQGPGYRSMCRWYSRRLFNALHAMGYEWVIRVDHDSEIPSTIPYNIVEQMMNHKAQYGLRAFDIDHAPVVYSLADAARYWIVSQRLDPADLWIMDFFRNSTLGLDGMSSTNYDLRIIYNNFFVTNVTWWMEPQVQGWLRYLEMLRGYHKFRWGDAATHLFTTGIYLNRVQLLEFDFDYKHWIHHYKPGDFGTRYPGRHVVYDGLPRLSLAKPVPK